ncbi:STAS domain-containing protein [Viridibacterium curvum]|uniref:MlaB-like STAS domain-containing protein n=1 Tax=Viridibacterium curvum TaxID=1101404 RepID=A0ABP9QXA7_9RHOO
MSDFTLRQDGKGRVAAIGDMTIFHAHQMKEALMTELGANERLEVDLSEVSDIDTAGLQQLLLLHKEAAHGNKPLRFQGHSPAVQQAVQMLKLEALLGPTVSVVWS